VHRFSTSAYLIPGREKHCNYVFPICNSTVVPNSLRKYVTFLIHQARSRKGCPDPPHAAQVQCFKRVKCQLKVQQARNGCAAVQSSERKTASARWPHAYVVNVKVHMLRLKARSEGKLAWRSRLKVISKGDVRDWSLRMWSDGADVKSRGMSSCL
jgi:hypothetical protein